MQVNPKWMMTAKVKSFYYLKLNLTKLQKQCKHGNRVVFQNLVCLKNNKINNILRVNKSRFHFLLLREAYTKEQYKKCTTDKLTRKTD